jgi:LAS superfamily LD-carboxypeptidase LdcB
MIGATGGGLALLSALGPAMPTTSATPAALVANAAVPPAPLGEQRDERASRSRRAAEPDPEPAPAEAEAVAVPGKQPAAPLLPGCDAAEHHVDRYANGRLPDSVLCQLPGDSDERLRSDAALAFARLAAAYEAGLEEPICLTDGYRTLAEQQQLRRIKPRYAARPGSSEHGWGLAVDLSCGVQSFRSKEHAWMVANAGNYGWFLPDWAKRGGARPEPWHWEFSGT